MSCAGLAAGLDADAASAFFNVSDVTAGHKPGSNSWMYSCMRMCTGPCLTYNPEPGFVLKLSGWTLEEDCSYRCFRTCQAEELRKGGQWWKYGGKWGHTRFLGMQEPAAVAFSVLNGAVHVAGAVMLSRARKTALDQLKERKMDASPLHQVYPHLWRQNVMAWVWSLAWLASAIFHCRDKWFTERLDYYSGNIAVAWMLFTGLTRCGWDTVRMREGWMQAAVGGVTAVGIGLHIADSVSKKIDYTRNMYVMIGMMVAHSLGWVAFCLANRRPHNWLFYTSNLLVYAAGALEIKDFPPVLGSMDAHAVWHAATPPLSYLFYRFLIADLRWELGLRLDPPLSADKKTE